MSYAGVATSIIGGELQGWASVLDKQAMGRAYHEELDKQQAYADQAKQAFNQNLSQNGFAPMQRGMDQDVASRMAQYQQVGKMPLGTGANVQSGYNPAVANAYTNMLGQARAKLGGYSDWGVQQAISNLATQRALNQITNFAGGQAQNVYPLQMYKAQHSMDDLAMIGQAISSIGGGAANYAQTLQGPGTQQPQVTGPTFSDFQNPNTYYDYNNPQMINPNTGYSAGQFSFV